MIAIAKQDQRQNNNRIFEDLLPAIHQHAHVAFRFNPREEREELIAEVVANAFCAFHRLAERGKTDLAYATPLAWYAIRQVRSGRLVGTSLNIHDVMSRYCQTARQITVDRLDQLDPEQDSWQEVLVEDRHATPADIAVTRIDFAVWLRGFSKHRRQIAKVLARGETTKATAKRFGLSPARISQMRREFQDAWREFQGEAAECS
jgi:hypothetical protein